MALTPEQIDAEAFARWGDMKGAPLAMCRGFARSIEAETIKVVRADAIARLEQGGQSAAVSILRYHFEQIEGRSFK